MAKFKNLVFEGGGVWGIAYEGVLSELEAKNAIDFQQLDRVGGASAGAITACLLAVGYTPTEIGNLLKITSFSDFQDDDLGFARDTHRLLSEYGWYKGNEFKKWIRKQIRAKIKSLSNEYGVNGSKTRPTFRELAKWQKALANKGYRLPALYMVGSNLSKQKRETYSAEAGHTPNLLIEDGVRRSMSIPLFFACSRGEDRDVIVDGGLTWNYPVNIFDDKKYLAPNKQSAGKKTSYGATDSHVFNTQTLGFRLDSPKEIEANLLDWSNKPVDIDNIVHYGWALVSFMRGMANKMHLHANDWSRTIFINIGEDIGFTNFDLTDDQQDFLVAAGRDGVRKYLDWIGSGEGKQELKKIYSNMKSS